jgi:hypothetical protein
MKVTDLVKRRKLRLERFVSKGVPHRQTIREHQKIEKIV